MMSQRVWLANDKASDGPTGPSEIYQQLETECLPLMTGYQADLTTHDKAAIEDNRCTPFLHWTHDTGTHIDFLMEASEYPKAGERVRYLFGEANRWHIVGEIQHMAEYFLRPCNEPHRYTVHHYDGVKLRKITVEKALEIAKAYRKRIEAEFSKTPEPMRNRYAFA